MQPKEVSDIMMAFPARVIEEGLLPPTDDIPKHEHKIAGVGFLLSQFFEKIS